MRYGARVLAACLALVPLAGCTAAPEPSPDEEAEAAERVVQPGTPERFAGQDIAWEACYTGGDLDEAVDGGGERDWLEGLECGTVAVPLDYADPDGRTIDLSVIRSAATGGGDERLGSLVVNPGGPGVAGSDALFHEPLSEDVRAAFDLVSFDPRGVGESEGFECGDWEAVDQAQRDVADTDPADLTSDQLGALEEAARAYADDCAETVGEEFLYNIGTVNVVRDLDVVRDALGDDQLTYLGYSYGTYVGALYAEMYPDNARALVLDGAVETEDHNAEVAYDQAVGFQESWEMFVEYCVNEMGECPFTSADGADEDMEEVFDLLDADPPVIEDEPVDSRVFQWMIASALYDEFLWEDIAQTVLAVQSEDDEAIDGWFTYLYEYAFGSYDDVDDDTDADAAGVGPDADAALTAINCADREDPTDIEAYREATERETRDAPLFGGGVWGYLPCAYWAETEIAPTGFTAPDAPPIVVVGTVGDPATPYVWAQELAGQLETATLVTYEGAGHTIYGYGVNPCVDRAVDDYLIDGTVPRDGLSCRRYW